MKTYFVMGGYGEMGRITSRDLAETAKGARIIIAGRNEKQAKQYAKKLGRNVTGVAADAADEQALARILKRHGVNVVVNCSLYYYNLSVMEACLIAGCHYVDLGGLFHTTRKQLRLDQMFRKAGLTAVLGCGATPGITNVLAGYGATMLDRVDSINVRFADYSWVAVKQHFVVPYSMYTVFDEFTSKPAVFKNGKMIFVKPMSGRAEEYFPDPVGKVTTFYTLHSEIATFPLSFKKKGIRNADFKVSFDQDFVHDVKVLIEAGFSSTKPIDFAGHKIVPKDFAVKEMNRLIPEHKKVKDIEYVRVTMTGKKNKKNVTLVIDCLAHSIARWQASAWDVNTGTTPSIVAQLIAKKIVKKKGVLPPEIAVPYKPFFRELSKRDMQVIVTKKEG